MKRNFALWTVCAAFAVLILFSDLAVAGARQGLAVCAATLAPSLLPFFTLAELMGALGLSEQLSAAAGPLLEKLFRVGPAGAEAFFLGLSGGYPLGAASVARLRREGRVSRAEAERLLAFCNNSGPAFITGGAGAVFQSPAAGLFLYAVHVLAAVCTGLILRGPKKAPDNSGPALTPETPLSTAFPNAVKRAAVSTAMVCAYVTLFSALLGLAGGLSFLPKLARPLAIGLAELGSGVAALSGFAPGPESLAAAAFLLGFGGLSVHAQTLGAVAGTDIKCARHLAGRALDAVLSGALAYVGGLLFFS